MDHNSDILTAFNSPAIEKRLGIIRDRKGKNAFLESIMADSRAIILNETNGHKTILFPGNKGPKTETWEQTKQMALELNEAGFDVAFIPELVDGTCADGLIKNNKIFKIVDFKYCITKKTNTLVMNLERGFEQADIIVLKLTDMDAGTFKKAIDYLHRNNIPLGEILLINRYGKVLDLLKKDFKTGVYKKKVKGHL